LYAAPNLLFSHNGGSSSSGNGNSGSSRLSVCDALTFVSLDVQSSFLVCRFIYRIFYLSCYHLSQSSRSSDQGHLIKVIGSRSLDQGQGHRSKKNEFLCVLLWLWISRALTWNIYFQYASTSLECLGQIPASGSWVQGRGHSSKTGVYPSLVFIWKAILSLLCSASKHLHYVWRRGTSVCKDRRLWSLATCSVAPSVTRHTTATTMWWSVTESDNYSSSRIDWCVLRNVCVEWTHSGPSMLWLLTYWWVVTRKWTWRGLASETCKLEWPSRLSLCAVKTYLSTSPESRLEYCKAVVRSVNADWSTDI